MLVATQLALGAIGGLARSVVGIVKHFSTEKNPVFDTKYFFITLIGSSLIGAFVGVLMPSDYRIVLASGYLGIDVVEGLVKSYIHKR